MSVRPLVSILGLLALTACTSAANDKGEFDFDAHLGGGGKADMLSSAHIVREIDLNSTLTGNFDPRVRVYGFTVQAKVGATLNIAALTAAGADSFDVDEGEELDTIMAVYGPGQNGERGPLLMRVDDDETGTAAQLPPLEVEEEGEYLVLLSSWNDTGHGEYIMDVTCEGTDFQCRRPVEDLPCTEGTEYILGGQTVGTTTWKRCNYVLLEETHVEEDAILTINPGVTVKGNFLGEAPYGSVKFVVDGAVQAIGTEDHPVVFTSLRDGWGGVVLGGNSSLENVYVENAEVGIEVVGDGNTLVDIDVNSSQTGIVFRDNTEGHSIQRGRIAQVENGIVMEDTVIKIEDTVILGHGDGQGIGIRGVNTEASYFSRALVSGFGTGIDLTSAELEMVDATITNNLRGVRVTGEDAGVNPAFECPPMRFSSFNPTPPRRSWPPARTTWGLDPIFRRVDLVGNSEYAVRIDAPELLIIEDSNVTGNGAGIVIASDSLHPESRISGNNIWGNGDGLMQLQTFHSDGVLDISGNYWAQISDPELSQSWDEEHDDYPIPANEADCGVSSNRQPLGCSTSGNSRTCGEYRCTWSNSRWNCDLTSPLTAEPWAGEVVFTGFSPVELDAGPDAEVLEDDVKDIREQQGLE